MSPDPVPVRRSRLIPPGSIRLPPINSLILQNIFWNYAGLFWLSALSIVSVSLYVRILGAHEWGLISACVSLQIVFNFLDMGFSQIAPKWFVGGADDRISQAGFFKLFQRTYFGLAFGGFLLLQLFATPLATQWFQVPAPDQPILEIAIRIIALQFLFQFMNGLNNAVWNGQQKQRMMNFRACAFMTLRHALTLSLLYFVLVDVRVYCMVFMLVSAAEWWTNHRRVGSHFAGSLGTVDRVVARKVFGEVGVLVVGVLIGTTVAQMDRIILSGTLPVQEFGVYTLVLTLAMSMLQLQMPITRSFFPRLVQDFRTHGTIARKTWLGLFGLTLVFIGAPALILSLLAYRILLLWLGNADMALIGAPALRLICLGVLLNAVYGCIYQLLLARGHNGLILRVNLVSLAAVGVLAALWPAPYTPLFGGVIWIVLGAVQILCGTIWYFLYLRKARVAKEQPF